MTSNYVRDFRQAVDAQIANPNLYNLGLCYALYRSGFGGSYGFMANFLRPMVDRLPEPGVMTDLRKTILLVLAELDDETILYIGGKS